MRTSARLHVFASLLRAHGTDCFALDVATPEILAVLVGDEIRVRAPHDRTDPDCIVTGDRHVVALLERTFPELGSSTAVRAMPGAPLSFAVGRALADQLRARTSRTYVLAHEAELADGQALEAIESAAALNLGDLVAIVSTAVAADGSDDAPALSRPQLADQLSLAGWQVLYVDATDVDMVREALIGARAVRGAPTALLACRGAA